ncbi:uncharacterized protein LOC110865655 isoform X1 [Helianthus annuus]|nr:uncharacterized protein LOC110865655 isoform X1 [Helianthus annuus]XP_035830560.1 uncharacterized protein LOC110865655 isoform X1 [Helianthus annuus]XP_035830561.1 uncharacterized protein LOC110865655 isoform X1 [Helianthus annuus]
MVGLYEFFYPGLKFESGDRGFSLSEFKLESIVRVGSLARTSKNLNEPTNKTIRKHNSKMASQSATSSVGVGSTATNASIVEPQFPVLAAMARDLLSVQASTVASESAFSFSGRVISLRRKKLSPESVEMCICLKDYLDAAERIQHVESLEDENGVETDIHEEEVEMGMSSPLEED